VRSLLRLRLYHQDLEHHESVVLSLSAALEARDPCTRAQRAGRRSWRRGWRSKWVRCRNSPA
jgi:hypothetical protein